MSNNLGIAISAAASGSFALLGVGLSNTLAGGRDRRIARTEAALELAETERLIWEGAWIELRAALQRQQTRMAVAGVPEDLLDAFRRINEACWRYRRNEEEESGGEQSGISTALLNAREEVHRAIRAHLLREHSRPRRRTLSNSAVSLADSALQRPPG